MGKEQDRFEVIYKEGTSLVGSAGLRQVLVDKATGATYLFVQIGYAGGLTPLLDAEGKPVITKDF